jgi:hypothetical protein
VRQGDGFDDMVAAGLCIEADSVEQACELLAGGSGYRCHLGDCVNIEVERVEE